MDMNMIGRSDAPNPPSTPFASDLHPSEIASSFAMFEFGN
jgi:hypothetical protein